ncbi:IclR family transcriptional regulator [Rhizobium sp. PP-F2F-G38]|nr:IclR family transcriptional regulator [Rhizobium sp. PP-WC-1G-195]PYE93001.1 IclR family transcriptional regulator [Rhizobium sp. PP-F2F-G38]TCQ15941.1 IclR family transcriptional regulator [Rhizobium sp. PP-CC-3G-465]
MTARPHNLLRSGTMTEAEDSPLYVTALAKGLSVLTAFGPSRPAMNLLELAEATGLNKSTIQRSVFTLEALGYLARDGGSKRYRLTVQSLEIGTGYLQTAELIERANPFIQQLNRQTGESCNLLEPWGTEMIYVARFTSHKEMPIHVPVGQRLPMYCTAAGRAYLSGLPVEVAASYIERSNRVAFTAHTVTDPAEILELLRRARTDGFSLITEEIYVGDIAVGANIVNADGQPLAAINLSVPFSRWRPEQVLSELAPQVVNTARAISSAAKGLKPSSAIKNHQT